MTDYQPLIARAIDGLAKNTGEARRALYERARTALVAQLRAVEPVLSESDITKERLALEDAIRKVEGEAARKALAEPRAQPRAEPRQEARASPPAAPPPPLGARALPGPSRARSPLGAGIAPRGERAHSAVAELPGGAHAETAGPEPLPPPHLEEPADAGAVKAAPKPSARSRILQARSSPLSQGGIKGFRSFMREADNLGTAPAQAAPTAREIREPYAPAPRQRLPRADDLFAPPVQDPLEEHFDKEHFDKEHFDEETERPAEDHELALRGLEPTYMEDEEPMPAPRYARPYPQRGAQIEEDRYDEYDEQLPPRSYRGWANLAMLLLVVVVAGAAAWEFRGNIAGLYHSIAGSKSQPPAHSTQATPPVKSTERVPQQSIPGTAAAPGASSGAQQAPQVAQRAVLYEADANDPQGKRFAGSAVWRTETVSPGPGLAPELVVRADITIPERHMTVTWSLRRNTDKSLPASHTIEINFSLPPDFPGGGISTVVGVLFKNIEGAPGTPLAATSVKVNDTYFLIGLSADATLEQHNLQLLKDDEWFDIPIVYKSGAKALLAIQRGPPGDHAFADAFAAWKE
jgi:hypothetical protein